MHLSKQGLTDLFARSMSQSFFVRGFSLLLLIVSILLAILIVPAITKGQSLSDELGGLDTGNNLPQATPPSANNSVNQLPGSAKRYALIIGVDKYEDTQINTLGGAANDAVKLAKALVQQAGFPEDQVILLASNQPPERQPTRGNILRRLSNLAGVVPKDGMLLVSFAGHGIERGGQAFLLPSDAQVSNDVNLLEETAISATRMKQRIMTTGVGQVIIIVDACRNDPAGRANADNPLTEAYTRGFNFDTRNKEVTAFVTLYATSVGNRAYEYKEKKQGYFTWGLIEALNGGAANEQGEVTLGALVNYLQREIPKRVRLDLGTGKEQRPFAVIEGYRANELVIAVTAPKLQPKGDRAANKNNLGVLFILTDPPTANITVKSRGVAVKQGNSVDSEFRAEMPPGEYDIEVTSAQHSAFTAKADVKVEREEVIRAKLTPTTGSIIIAPVEADAVILIDGKKPDPDSIKTDKAEKQIEINNIADGSHTLRITGPNTTAWEKQVAVKGGAKIHVVPQIKTAMVSLVVKSEPGAEIYLDGSYHGKVNEDGQTGVLELNPGQHKIEAAKREYQSAVQTKEFKAGDALLELKLNRITFSPEFSDYFIDGTKFWHIPQTWQVSKGKVIVKGRELGLVREKIYKDFKMEFDISFANGKGAVWIVRAADERNYYIFQLSGPQSDLPNTFRSYLCQNGKVQLLKTDSVAEDLSKPGDSFHIIIEAKGPTIKHSIEVKSAPKSEGPQPLGLLTDNALTYGSVGFSAINGEESIVYFINVTPLE